MKKKGKRKSRKAKLPAWEEAEKSREEGADIASAYGKKDYGGLPETDLKKNLGCG